MLLYRRSPIIARTVQRCLGAPIQEDISLQCRPFFHKASIFTTHSTLPLDKSHAVPSRTYSTFPESSTIIKKLSERKSKPWKFYFYDKTNYITAKANEWLEIVMSGVDMPKERPERGPYSTPPALNIMWDHSEYKTRRPKALQHKAQRREMSTTTVHASTTTTASVMDSLDKDGASTMAKSAERSHSTRRTIKAYIALSKPHLTALVVLTSMASYALFPTSELLSSEPSTPTTTLSALTLLFLTVGTSLCSASANSLNMLMEPHLDAKMTRTRNRPLVRGLLSKPQALIFAIITGTTGTLALYYGINPTVAALGLGNIVLYAGVYTPLKRVHVVNTWVGALVGGIPPLMGWAAAANADATSEDWLSVLSHPGGWLLAGLLFAWQFPHFNALSFSIRKEYAAAGYKMLASTNMAMTARVAVRYSLALFPICWGLWYTGVTDGVFVIDSGIVNAWLLYEAVKFWKYEGERGTAKRLFWASVWHLPAVLVLAMAHKKGLWSGLFDGLIGRPQVEVVPFDEEWDDYENDEGGVSIVAGTAR